MPWLMPRPSAQRGYHSGAHRPLRAVLGQAAVTRLRMTELSLDHAKRILDGGADRCLEVC